MFRPRSLMALETEMFTETVSSRDAAPEPAVMHSRRVFVNISVSCTKPSHRALGVAEIGTGEPRQPEPEQENLHSGTISDRYNALVDCKQVEVGRFHEAPPLAQARRR